MGRTHNIKKIITGWKNFIEDSGIDEQIVLDRASICAECTSAKKGMLTAFIKDKLKQIEGYYCKECKCPLSAKIRTPNENCDLKKWGKKQDTKQ